MVIKETYMAVAALSPHFISCQIETDCEIIASVLTLTMYTFSQINHDTLDVNLWVTLPNLIRLVLHRNEL